MLEFIKFQHKMPVRLTIEEVRERVEAGGCQLISMTYSSNKNPIEIKCSCGNQTPLSITFSNFNRGIRCPACRYERLKATNLRVHGYEFVSQRPEKKASACAGMRKYVAEKKYTIEEARAIFEEKGCTLLSTEYKDARSPLDFICSCKNLGRRDLHHFLRGQRCNDKKCMGARKKLTNLKQFNSVSYTGTDEYKERRKETCLARYGVEDPAQCPAVRSKMKRTAFATKKYTFPSGVTVDIQGYEHFALDELLKMYDETDLLTDDEDQPEIWWTDSCGKRHRYFSDIYIPSAKKVIEVKSTYTAALHPEKLARCRVAAEAAGYVYEVWIYSEKGERTFMS